MCSLFAAHGVCMSSRLNTLRPDAVRPQQCTSGDIGGARRKGECGDYGRCGPMFEAAVLATTAIVGGIFGVHVHARSPANMA